MTNNQQGRAPPQRFVITSRVIYQARSKILFVLVNMTIVTMMMTPNKTVSIRIGQRLDGKEPSDCKGAVGRFLSSCVTDVAQS